jgi:hypothetical protein
MQEVSVIPVATAIHMAATSHSTHLLGNVCNHSLAGLSVSTPYFAPLLGDESLQV